MGKFKDDNGKTRIGTFLKDLGDIGDPILTAVGNATGFKALNTISDMITTSTEISDQNKQEAISLLQLDREDLSNARSNNTEIQKSQFSSWMAKNVPFILDLFIGIIWGAMTIFIVAKYFKLVDNVNVDFTGVLGIYAAVTGQFSAIVQFHRGSSAGSKMKDFIK